MLPHGVAFPCGGELTLLDAALAAGHSVPFSCKRGACGSCLANVVDGLFEHNSLTPPQDGFAVGPGQLLMCQSRACGDITLSVPNWTPENAPTSHTVRVASITPLGRDVVRLVVDLSVGDRLANLPGQHVRVLLPDGDHRCFSIANQRSELDPLEFHIRRVPGGAFSDVRLAALHVGDELTIVGPQGTCTWQSAPDDADRLVILATGTGYAGVRALLRPALESKAFMSIELYWGGRDVDDHYARTELDALAVAFAGFEWMPVSPQATKAYPGQDEVLQRHVQDHALAVARDWGHTVVYACGHPGMIRDARTALVAAGLPPTRWHAESFVQTGSVSPSKAAPHPWERVGTRFERSGILLARRRSIDALRDIVTRIEPGMTTAEAIALADKRLLALGASRNWHPTYVRFGPDTLCFSSQPGDRTRRLREDDLFTIDIGPVWDGYEGDYGDTFVLGDDADHLRCVHAARSIFRDAQAQWRRGLSGADLYAYAAKRAHAYGCELVREVAGHRIADFPHALYGKQRLAAADFLPGDGVWVLEIQVRDLRRPIGAFFEDVLLREPVDVEA